MHPRLAPAAAMAAAQRRALAAMGAPEATVAALRQVHGAELVALEAAAAPAPEADGAITQRRSLALLVYSADCLPVLAASARGGAVGVAHAGWRGARANIAAALVAQLAAAGTPSSELRVAFGWSIGRCCFVVGDEVAEALAEATPPGAAAVVAAAGRGRQRVDLAGLVRAQLQACGVAAEHIEQLPGCTACDDGLFSYRRDGGLRGCQGALIALRATG